MPIENPSVPAAKEIAASLIECAKAQCPSTEITKSTLASALEGFVGSRLTNRFLLKNPWGFAHAQWQFNPEISFIDNAHAIHELMVPKKGLGNKATVSTFEKQLHGVSLRSQPKGPWTEKNLEETRAHLALSATEVTLFASSNYPLNLTLISSKTITGKTIKLRGGQSRKQEDHVDVSFAISRQGWEAPSAIAAGFKSLGLACLWLLSCFAYRPRLNREMGEVEKHFSYRVKA